MSVRDCFVVLALTALAWPLAPGTAAQSATAPASMTRPVYPKAKKVDVVDDYHGTRVADPYRWLENAEDPDTTKWVDAQNAMFRRWVDGPDPRRHPRPAVDAGGLPAHRRTGASRFAVLLQPQHRSAEPARRVPGARGCSAEWHVLIDPNTLSSDGTAALTGLFVNEQRHAGRLRDLAQRVGPPGDPRPRRRRAAAT